MAYIKEKIIPSGFTCNYWKIVKYNDNDDSINVEFNLYKDKQARNNGYDPIFSEKKYIEMLGNNRAWGKNENFKNGDNPKKLIYIKIKQIDEFFQDSEDDI
jgi:hypothetical protein